LVGGDTSSSLTGMLISITAVGYADRQKLCYRSGAKPTNLICVTGDLGAAYMGLQLLEREKRVFAGNEMVKPQLTGYDYILERFLKPEARVQLIDLLNENDILPTAMIDISDGLSSELLHICKNSQTGCRVYIDRIPIDQVTQKMATELNIDPVVAALSGGEDYELLFTVDMKHYDKVSQMAGVKIIGHITAQNEGAMLITPHGDELTITAQGWNAIKPE
jgi:thiamine-monophosphate kinase